ncbi:MAG: hypothetical protein EOO65_02655, partial [Methanosarcinales archaeon]
MNADVYLLDDPLSAVDARVSRLLFEKCICGFLSSKCRVLVTHQLQYLQSADNVLVLNAGRVLVQGSFAQLADAVRAAATVAVPAAAGAGEGDDGVRLAEGGGTFGALPSAAAAADPSTNVGAALMQLLQEMHEEEIEGEGEGEALGDATAEFDESTDRDDASARARRASSTASHKEDSVLAILRSGSNKGRRTSSTAVADAGTGGGHAYPRTLPTATVEALSVKVDADTVAASSSVGRAPSTEKSPDVVLSLVASPSTAATATPTATAPTVANAAASSLVQAETVSTGIVGFGVYGRYFSAMGNWVVGLYVLTLLCVGAALFIYSNVWLANWATLSASEQRERVYPAVYGGIVAACFVFSLWRTLAYFVAAVAAGQRLHDAAFARVLRAPIHFFDANPAGRILNRFSKDIGLIVREQRLT